jgi:hypothetical protein
LRFGQEAFEEQFKRTSPISKKLTKMLEKVSNKPFDEGSEIVQIVKSLAARRNRLVHPRPELEIWAEDGARTATTKRVPKVDPESAAEAVNEMERFFQLFGKIDREAMLHLRTSAIKTPRSR